MIQSALVDCLAFRDIFTIYSGFLPFIFLETIEIHLRMTNWLLLLKTVIYVCWDFKSLPGLSLSEHALGIVCERRKPKPSAGTPNQTLCINSFSNTPLSQGLLASRLCKIVMRSDTWVHSLPSAARCWIDGWWVWRFWTCMSELSKVYGFWVSLVVTSQIGHLPSSLKCAERPGCVCQSLSFENGLNSVDQKHCHLAHDSSHYFSNGKYK